MVRKVACAPQVGADPELFIKPLKGGTIVPCVGLIPGTKAKPFTPKYMQPGFAIQEDNVMCEFNVPPQEDAYEAQMSLLQALEMVTKELKAVDMQPALGVPTHRFTTAQLTSDQAKAFGCEPDFDAYTGGKIRGNPVGNIGMNRSCGGHIHMGGDFKCPDFVAALFAELAMGVGCDGAFTKADKKDARKVWYGMPGVFRPKPYGIEYRTPDNQWIRENWRIEMMYQAALTMSRWLTNTASNKIQNIFRSIPWTQQRDFMMNGQPEDKEQLINQARELGVPV